MKPSDRKLGMDRPITRRDMLQGMALVTAGSALPIWALASSPSENKAYRYPPLLDGLRGNHVGSFEMIHQVARYGRRDWGSAIEPDHGIYDLVVVGAGISGLTAAYYYRRKHPKARILILDNHDDFGGHAKRNEFEVDGHRLIGYGGTQTLQEPSGFSRQVKSLLKDLGVDIGAFGRAYDQNFYTDNNLGAGLHFGREQWGKTAMVRFDLGCFQDYIPVAESPLTVEQAVSAMPISARAKRQFVSLLNTTEDQIPELSGDDKWDYLSRISYRDFLIKHLAISENGVFDVLQDLASDSGVGIDSVSALGAISYGGLPGWEAAGLPDEEEAEPYIHHFPDGNASIARQLVRRMIPSVAPGTSMEDLLTAEFDYGQLDQQDSAVRVRLDSSVVLVKHDDNEGHRLVNITYIRDGQAFLVKAHGTVLACNNSVIPSICPELPAAQREALAFQVKIPILYTSVALRNWRAWKKMGIGAVMCPGSYHINATLDFPVSFGDYQYAANPDEPVIVHMERFPHKSNQGLTARQQYRAGRHELVNTSFETIERNVREQLAEMLGEGGFDPARDIAGITVNRWAHGYAYWYNPLYDPIYEDYNDERYPHMIARKPFGRITIANSDSAATAMTEAAIEQGYRAAKELG
ncbi:MAG: FAD-dependent oxidoreductase [Porticoccaceae bacterium]|jgi:spermidine dehydrogenase|nr:FAD-dependent oxidoreductase [Porticoccaceae bacterium]